MITDGILRDRKDVKRIEFHDSTRGAAQDAWDASEAGDGSVLAWLDGGVLHFAAQGGVIAPEDSSWLFADYERCKEIHFNGCFDTSRATNMSCMFYGCTLLQTLNLSGFDTSRAENMYCMFGRCISLQSLDLSAFDTSRVTRMSFMFSDCGMLQLLNLSGFDTSRVKLMMKMFYGCGSLTALDLSGFRFAENVNVDKMLANCHALRRENILGFAALPPEAQACVPELKRKPQAEAKPNPQPEPKPCPQDAPRPEPQPGSRELMGGIWRLIRNLFH